MSNNHSNVSQPLSPARTNQLQKDTSEEFAWLNIQVLLLPFGDNTFCGLSLKKIAFSAVTTSQNPRPCILSKSSFLSDMIVTNNSF